MTAHQFNKSDTIAGGARFCMRSFDSFDGGCARCLVAEAFICEHYIVVDGLGNANYRNGIIEALGFGGNLVCAA